MNVNQQFVEEIEKLGKIPKIKKLLTDRDENIWESNDEYENLKKLYLNSRFRKYKKRLKFSQLVRQILDPRKDERKYMDSRLHILLRYYGNTDHYFEILTEDGQIYSYQHPLSELDRLEELYEEFVQIFTDIKNRIDFDFPEVEYVGHSIHGKTNWQKTILNNKTSFPLKFYSKIKERKYETEENILLILCVEWMYRDAQKIYEMDSDEPLDDSQTRKLDEIIDNTRNILVTFPYTSVLNTSKRLWNENYRENLEILQLEKTVKERLDAGTIKNKKYYDLLEWIKKYKDLYLEYITNAKTSSRPITAIEAQDYMFEAWIFFEMLDYVEKQKGIRCHLTFGKYKEYRELDENDPNRFFKFKLDGADVIFYYEKKYINWLDTDNFPDFTVTVNGKLIYILDAKNYAEDNKLGKDAKDQLLSYMIGLDCGMGSFILPYYPTEDYVETKENPDGKTKVDFLRITPSWKLAKKRTQSLEHIFEIISEYVKSLKN